MLIIKIKNTKAKIYSYSNTKKSDIRLFGTFTIISKNNKPQILNVKLKKSNNNEVITNEEFHDLLKDNKISIVYKHKEFEEYLKNHNIDYSYTRLCINCLEIDHITPLTEKTAYKYNDNEICYNCAEFEVESLLYDYSYYSNGRRPFIKYLKDTKDLSLVIDMILNGINPIKNPEYTLYDKIESNEEEFAKISIDDVAIPKVFKAILKRKIKYLLPVQILALNQGLLYNEDLLVVSQTASGKTLIAELAGITKALKNKKFIYLSPLVALANQKYRYFKESYSSLGLNVVIRVGKNRINAEDELKIIEKPVDNADIIVATYEGLDYILRSGKRDSLNDLGVVVIDEIHMLDNAERGSRLNGLINRLITLYPQAQLIGLSATINNPKQLARNFNMKLVEYEKRPVSLERHVIPVNNNNQKLQIIAELCKKEFATISPMGYKGQTIIFTDSRRKTEEIAMELNKKNVTALSYHAGLSYANKVDIELKYANQEISTVVTTAALAAGVDFPASQVIFDSMRMGREWLTANEFHQMMGRAGRPSYQENGKVFLFFEVGKSFRYVLEEDVAYELLESSVEDIRVNYTIDDTYEQVLADISSLNSVDAKVLEKRYYKIDTEILFSQVIEVLLNRNMISYDSMSDTYSITDYGRCVSKSFLKIHEAELIKDNLTQDPIDVATSLEKISNVYLSNRLMKLFMEYNSFISTRLFADSNKELIHNPYIINTLSNNDKKRILNILMDFKGDCDDVYCDCLEINISKHIIKRRIYSLSPKEISKEFKTKYSINIYSGDIYNYLDQVIRYLEAIERISNVFGITSTKHESKRLIKKIEG